MQRKFENGQNHQFYVGVTESILSLVRAIRSERPKAFQYRGMDFSHVFESSLYFSAVNDAALYELYEAHDRGAISQSNAVLTNELSQLVAKQWFGTALAKPQLKKDSLPASLFRWITKSGNWLSAYSAPRPALRSANLPSRCDILVYARSQRFANYQMPLIKLVEGRCAFFVPAGDHDLQRSLAKTNIPFIAAGTAHSGYRAPSLTGWYAQQMAFFADSVELVLKSLRPRIVVLPEGNSPDDEVINQVGHQLGIPVVCIQQGWSPIVHPGFCNLSYDAMMMWGDGFSDLLRPRNPKQEFVSTGNFMLSSEFSDPLSKPSGTLFFHGDVGHGLGGARGWEMMIALAEWVAKARPDLPVYCRPHPLVPFDDETTARLTRWPNVMIQRADRVSIAQALNAASVSVSIYSTTILESVAAGVVPIIFNMTTMPRFWPDVAAEGAGLELHTHGEAAAALTRLLSDDDYLGSFAEPMARFSHRYFCARGSEALHNVVAQLERIIRR